MSLFATYLVTLTKKPEMKITKNTDFTIKEKQQQQQQKTKTVHKNTG